MKLFFKLDKKPLQITVNFADSAVVLIPLSQIPRCHDTAEPDSAEVLTPLSQIEPDSAVSIHTTFRVEIAYTVSMTNRIPTWLCQ